jgi:hypothetical protein
MELDARAGSEGRNVLLGEFSFFEQKIEGIHSFSTV